MVTLTIVCCFAVLFATILLFNRELDSAVQDKVEVALNVVTHELDEMLAKSLLAALAMSSNQDLADALLANDHENAARTALALQIISGLDYCIIVDTNGIVIARTNDPGNTGDNISHLPHVKSALSGNAEAHIIQGPTIRLGTSAGAPVYNEHGEIIGAVTLGFMLNKQDFAYRLRDLTGCEISLFSDN